jgi:hypothetical protein
MEGIRMVAVFPGHDTCETTFNRILHEQVIAVKEEEGTSLVAVAKEAWQISEGGVTCVYEVTASHEVPGDFEHACATLIDKMVDKLGHHYIKVDFYETKSFVSK